MWITTSHQNGFAHAPPAYAGWCWLQLPMPRIATVELAVPHSYRTLGSFITLCLLSRTCTFGHCTLDLDTSVHNTAHSPTSFDGLGFVPRHLFLAVVSHVLRLCRPCILNRTILWLIISQHGRVSVPLLLTARADLTREAQTRDASYDRLDAIIFSLTPRKYN